MKKNLQLLQSSFNFVPLRQVHGRMTEALSLRQDRRFTTTSTILPQLSPSPSRDTPFIGKNIPSLQEPSLSLTASLTTASTTLSPPSVTLLSAIVAV